jgi:[acyl-carrier-protein] S-malonyltransferase
MVGHRRMSQQLHHAIVMCARCSNEETPELAALRVEHAEPKRDAQAAIDALIRQVASPVRWEAVVKRLASEGVTTYVEVGPGSVLSGLVRKIHREATALTFGTPDDLASVESLLHV